MKHTFLSPILLAAFVLILTACGGAPQAPQAQPGVAAFSLSGNKSELTLPDLLELAVALENIGDKAVDKIEYFRGDQKIGESQGASFVWNATAESAGVAEGASATLNLSAKASLSDGSSLSSNSLSVQASASSAAFVLSLEPSGLVLQNGQGGSAKVKRSNLNGFSGDISISLVNPPAGVSAQALTLKEADSEATLNLSAAGAALGGPLEVVVRGESGSKSATVALALTIAAAPVAGAPELAFALDKALITTPETVQLSSSLSNLGSKTVSKVEFFRGATMIGEDTSAPYGMSWNATEQNTGVAAGNTQSISLIAKATLNDGSIVTSSLQNLSVTVPAAPKLEASLQPFSVTVPQGMSASIFLTIKRTNLAGEVAVSLQNPPAGISLTPTSIAADKTSALMTLKVAGNVSVGVKNLVVQSSIGAVATSANLQVNVTAPVSSGSYTLSVVAGNLSIEQGKSFDVPIKVNRIGGYSKEVKLFAGIIPPGVSATFKPSTLSGNETNAILTLSASHNALAETPAQFAVFAQAAGELVQVDNFTLTISGIHGSFISAHKFTLSKEPVPTLWTRFTEVVALPDGKFAVAAMSSTKYNGNTFFDGSVLRILPDGNDDTSFGMSNYGWEIYYQNQIVGERMAVEYEVTVTGLTVAGNSMYISGCARRRDNINDVFLTRQAFVNKRSISNGAPDNNFGPNGTRFYTLYGNSTISCFNGIAASAANLFTAGYINTNPMRIGLGMMGLSGTMDSSYQANTQLNTVIPNTTASAAATTCTIGETQYVGGNATAAGKERSVVLAYRNSGIFSGFSSDGIMAFDPDQGGNAVYDLLCLPSAQKLVTAGYAKTAGGKPNFAVARLTSSGALDNSFGGDGMVTTSIGGGKDVAAAVEGVANGAVIVAGHTTNPNGQRDIAIVKYNSDGTLNQGFGIGGKVIRDLGGDEVVTGMAIAPNGTIALVGNSNNQGFIAFFQP